MTVKPLWVNVKREDGAVVEMLFDPEDLRSISRLVLSVRDPLALEHDAIRMQQSRDYWQDRCLKAEATLNGRAAGENAP